MKSMVFMIRTPYGDHVQKAMNELTTGSDRAVAIVGGAIVETQLQGALIAYMHRHERITKELFRTTGAFGSFSVKIDLGLLIGLYGAAAHRDLVTIKDIRNRFAHSLEVNDFSAQQIKAWAANLKLGERYAADSADVSGTEPPSATEPNIGKMKWWFAIEGRNAALNDPRDRFLLTAGVLTYGLSAAAREAMPSPLF